MYRIAIVEDMRECREQLISCLERFQQERNVPLQYQVFHDGMSFIHAYDTGYDVVLMDIEMPNLSGMDAARQLRRIDEDVCLIFVTGFTKYAFESYEVRAMDYILKPVAYKNFSLKLQRALDIHKKLHSQAIRLDTLDGMRRILPEDLYYIEIVDHTLYYHTTKGVFEERGSIKEKEEMLAQYGFARCNNSFLVNLRHVTAVSNGRVTVQDRSISIGRTKKQKFLKDLTDYVGDYRL